MEKKERQKLIKSLDLMNGFPEWKIPCSCPKGGMYEEGSICSKCGGSEWIVNPELVALFEKELDKAREEVERKFVEKYHKRGKEMNVPYSEEDGKEFWQGYKEGYNQGLKDMIVDTYYLDKEFELKLKQ